MRLNKISNHAIINIHKPVLLPIVTNGMSYTDVSNVQRFRWIVIETLDTCFYSNTGKTLLCQRSGCVAMAPIAYVVSVLEQWDHGVAHAVVVHGHEDRVDDDTQRDEHVDKRVHYE